MEVRLRKDAKMSTIKANLIKALRKRDWAERDVPLEDTCQVRTQAEQEAIEERFYDACDNYYWHLTRYKIARDRLIGPQQTPDDNFRRLAFGEWSRRLGHAELMQALWRDQ
tara:strand:+ start:140 stop:472 length:333 start_codon:yes stop_codon:yes gene_type:complete